MEFQRGQDPNSDPDFNPKNATKNILKKLYNEKKLGHNFFSVKKLNDKMYLILRTLYNYVLYVSLNFFT